MEMIMKHVCRFLFFILIATGMSFSQTPYGNNPKAGNYVSVNGIKMYYEIYGEGAPLVLLHGNGGSIRSQGNRIDYFSKKYKVIAIDSRAHGKTIDSTSVLNYELMAKDVNDLLDTLKIDSAYIWGQSDGGILAVLLSIHYPGKVRKAAGFGTNIRPDSTAILPELMRLVEGVAQSTKNKKEKQLMTLLINEPHIPVADLRKIRAPFMVMMGDRDAVQIEHSVEIFRNIPKGFLFVMPASTHFGVYEHPEWFNMIVEDFFTKPYRPITTLEAFNGAKQ
jgi:pimeloyl-ACP methyl ester carboxylesterase